jgi:hypothetical protein
VEYRIRQIVDVALIAGGAATAGNKLAPPKHSAQSAVSLIKEARSEPTFD